ncbi:inorganic phosphate transporter [Xanthomonas translucens pv. graminis]|uniref:inorganic phosphate transporter n=1 Tax=Xanthomonas graminis TaxID=3390026 RepID=UPI0025419ADE|nr:inorganic phosphate transporter [Xanthomonas translucens]WIH06463.1 inorganic phosphate transporter [Xanthomonas translucens pv. graminis]
MLTLVLIVILAALVFEFINGFHDTANSIATVVATKVLSPGWAVILAAGMNLLGALTGTAVAMTIASGLLNTDVVTVTPQVILCALLGGIVWNLITWWKGLPSSSSHALIGGLCGAGLAAAHNNWGALIWSQNVGDWARNKGLLWKVFVPMITSPIAGFLLGIAVMLLLWAIIAGMAALGGRIGRLARPRWIIAMTLVGAQSTGALDELPSWLAFLHPAASAGQGIATWIVLTCAVVMAAGTASGGWKIIKTLGHKMVKLHPIHGFAAETSSATILTLAAHFGMPVSTTHSISTAIMGVGFAKNPRSLRFGVIERIVWAWILTIPAAAGVAYLIFRMFALFGWVG